MSNNFHSLSKYVFTVSAIQSYFVIYLKHWLHGMFEHFKKTLHSIILIGPVKLISKAILLDSRVALHE